MTHPIAARLHHRRRPYRPGVSFALVNGSALVVHVLLACSTAELLATRVWRETSIGELTLLLQGSLLVWTAARYDRRADRGPAPHAYGEESR